MQPVFWSNIVRKNQNNEQTSSHMARLFTFVVFELFSEK